MIPLKSKVKSKGLMKSVPSGVLAPKSLATKPVKPLQKSVFPSTSSSSSLGSVSTGPGLPVGARPPLDESWRDFCEMTTVDFSTYATSIQESIEQGKMNKLARLLTAAFRTFIDKKSDQSKFNIEYQLLTIAALTIKEHHEKIQHVALQKCLLNLMCRMKPMTSERQGLISAIVVTLASGQPVWDPYYVTAYLHDSLGDRNWVYKPNSSFIASQIVKGFGTIYPTKDMFTACNLEMDLDFIPEGLAIYCMQLASDRFPSATAKEEISAIALNALAPWWDMRADNTPALFLRAIAPLMALPEVRFNVVKRIDGWLQHVKLQRLALQLLILVGLNYGNASDSAQEKSVLARLLQMRMLKNKNVTSVFTVSLREMLVRKNDCNMRTAIRLLLENEFGHVMSRHPHNVSILISMFGFDRTRTAEVLGEEISEMIMAREDYCKPVRLLLREIIRFFHRNEFPFYTLANSYLSTIVDEVAKSEHGIQEQSKNGPPVIHKHFSSSALLLLIKDHVFRCASELLSAVTLMSISASVREAFNARRTGSNYTPDLVLVHDRFENALSEYLEGIVRWLQGVRHIFPSAREYLQAYHKLLFMERPEVYCALEQGPTEAEYMTCFKVICECRLKESILRMILGEHITMLDNQEAIRLIEGLTKRAVENRVAADAHLPLIALSNPVQLIDRLFQLSGYRCQPGVTMPDEFNCFATKKYYWKAWYIVMMWACAGKVGSEMEKIYSTYPQLRLFIHMVLVKSFRFPLEFEGKTPEEWEAVEAETTEKEKEAILAMESFLSKCSMEEESSKLIGTICFNQPRGMPRRPPEPVIRKLEVLAIDCSMASRLCECRQPDMVDQLIRNVGPSKAMPAIQELFATNSSAIEAMPASTLCQYLHYDLQRRKVAKVDESSALHMIVGRVRSAFADASVQDDCVNAVLFLLDKRTAFNVRERLGAKLVLTILFTDPNESMDLDQVTEGVWMRGLQNSAFYSRIASSMVTQLARAALDSDGTQLDLLLSTIQSQMDKENMHQLSILLAVLVENFGKASPAKAQPLLDVFLRYVELCAGAPEMWPADSAFPPGRKVVKYIVELAGQKMFMTADAVEAILRLLCYTSGLQGIAYRKLAEVWLPENSPMPKVTCDGKPVDLLTSKLRAFMLQFDYEKIVKIAMQDLDPTLALKVACEMSAMRPAHASHLLKIACESRPLTKSDVMSLDKTARVMLNIHSINGIEYAQQVLTLLDEIQKSGEEKMEVSPFHSITPRKATEIIEPPPAKPMSRQEMVQHLKAATIPNAPFVLSWNIWRDTQRAEDVAMAVVEHLEGNLKFFLGDREAFNLIFAVLGPCAKKFPSVKRRLSTFSAKVLKSAATSPAIEGHLRQYVPNAPAPANQKKKELTEEEMLEVLHTKVIPAGYSRALLLNKFLQHRVEIFKRNADPAEFDAQMMAIFGDSGIEELVAQMPLRSPLKTIETVFLRLLSTFNTKYNPKIVCSFFMINAIREFCREWTAQQWACLAQYVVEMVMGDPQQMKAAVNLIDRLVDLTNVEVVVPIAEVIVTLARSDLPIEKRKHAQALLDDIQLKYPCLFVDPLANQASIQGFRWRQRDTDGLVTTLVAQAVDPNQSDSFGAVRTLTQLVETYPKVMIRNFGTMAQQIPLLTRMPSALRKEMLPFVAFVLDATQRLLPSMREASYRYVLGDAVHAFLSFYETISNSEAAAYFGEKLLSCCMRFFSSHTETAKEVFNDRSDVITLLLQKLPPGNLNAQMMQELLHEPDMETT